MMLVSLRLLVVAIAAYIARQSEEEIRTTLKMQKGICSATKWQSHIKRVVATCGSTSTISAATHCKETDSR
eukprot:scaffold7163_cov19-Prasinocladus_malaysianus.AAC.1